jgi:DNA polymerase-1
VREFERQKQVEFNISSSDHVGEALATYGRIELPRADKSGKWSTDESELLRLAPDNPLVRSVLEYREAQKQISTYLDAVIRYCEENVDGRLHPQYTTMHVATTRLSSEEPNIQNFPKRRHRELRSQIVAPHGHVLAAFDMKQLEARVYGMASRDRALCGSIISGEDIHQYWLDKFLNRYPDYIEHLKQKTNEVEVAKAVKGGRDIIKTDFVFASLYGSIAKSCAERTGLPLVIVEEILDEFWKRYAGAKTWIREKRNIYKDTGSVSLLNGLIRHGYMGGNETINTPIQGTGAVLVLAAQNALSELSRKEREHYLHPRINIHDDLTFVLPDDETIAAYIEVIAQEMVKVRFPWQTVPLAVEVKIGYNWAELEYVADFTGDYVR